VWELYGGQIAASLPNHELLFFPGGEVNKRLSALEELAEQMVARSADRASVVIAVGGGIVNDVGGFLAAVFMRGIPVIQVPTTLLAQVDASVGGKTGVNLCSGKNLIGSFHQPLAVLIDPLVLASLPDREYRAGLFEIIKCGIIADADLFEVLRTEKDRILARDSAVLERIISDSVRIKAEVVSADEKEGGLRRILNFGHTF
jgi:3-dehydroquinate synthase